jgi:homoserine O-acetyltransferase
MRDGIGLPASSHELVLAGPVRLEQGDVLASITLGYNTYGALNAQGDNCIVVGHSLTSNSCIHEWWAPMLGAGPAFALDTSRFYIVCANYLGSVYGSSGPLSVNPATGARFAADFPLTTIRDNVRMQRRLLDHLGVRSVAAAVGGSLGGMLALEWAATFPTFVRAVAAVACCARHS